MDPALWIAFVGTVIVMQMPPGPDSMLVMARGIGQTNKSVVMFSGVPIGRASWSESPLS